MQESAGRSIREAIIAGAIGLASPRPNDEQARFAALYQELFPAVYGFVRFRVGDPRLAEDLTASVFERALSRLAAVRRADQVRAWIFAIARNAVADARRSRDRAASLHDAERAAHTSAHAALPLLVESPEEEVIHRDDVRHLVASVATLSDREREVIGLRFVAGLRHRQIAHVMGLSEANVGQILHRALGRLRCALSEVAGQTETDR